MAAGNSMVSLTGLSFGRATELQLGHRLPLSLIGLEHEIAVDDHAHRKSGPDRQRRLDVEIAADDLLTGLVDALGSALRKAWTRAFSLLLRAGLRSDAEQVERTAALNSVPQWLSTSSSSPE